MQIIPSLQKELEIEISILRKFLAKVPTDKFDWKPHEKNMDMKTLCAHLADIPGWVEMGLTADELDFATSPYKPKTATNADELLTLLDTAWQKSKTTLDNAKEDDLLPTWTMRSGDQIFMKMSKYEVIRHALGQIIHHRAQLGVYFRLLNVPVPSTYGPSADDQSF